MYQPSFYHKSRRGATKSSNYGIQDLQVAQRDLELTKLISGAFKRGWISRPRARQLLRKTSLFSTMPIGPFDHETDNQEKEIPNARTKPDA